MAGWQDLQDLQNFYEYRITTNHAARAFALPDLWAERTVSAL
jgi:hypothetical protein